MCVRTKSDAAGDLGHSLTLLVHIPRFCQRHQSIYVYVYICINHMLHIYEWRALTMRGGEDIGFVNEREKSEEATRHQSAASLHAPQLRGN